MNQCGAYLSNFFIGQTNEVVYLLCLDAKCGILGLEKVGEGSVNSTSVSIRKVMEIALAYNATSVILAHNHPGGLAMPSGADVRTTQRIAASLDPVGIQLVDHVVVSDGDFVSMRQSGMYNP
jgi:DNA repair protein RadC